MTSSASLFNPVRPLFNPNSKLIMPSLSEQFRSLRCPQAHHWNSSCSPFCPRHQQAIHVVNLVLLNMENISAVTQETWWSVVHNTLKFPGSLRAFGIIAFWQKSKAQNLTGCINQYGHWFYVGPTCGRNRRRTDIEKTRHNVCDQPGSFSNDRPQS